MIITTIGYAALRIAYASELDPSHPYKVDIGTVVEFDEMGNARFHSETRNGDSYVPILSTLIGVARIARNVFQLLGNFFDMLRGQHSPRAALGAMCGNLSGIAMGAIELVPVVGNLAIYAIDDVRIALIESRLDEQYPDKRDGAGNDSAKRIYYANGRYVCESKNTTIREDFSPNGVVYGESSGLKPG